MVGVERRLVHDVAKRAQERYLLLTPEFSREKFQSHTCSSACRRPTIRHTARLSAMSEVTMAKARKANPDGYVHTRDAKNISVCAIRRAYGRGATAGVLAAVGLRPGMSCLDVRSGPGAVMRLMADRVGPQGLVTGIEIDSVLGAEALRDLRTQSGADFQQIAADLLTLETPPGAPSI